MKKLLAMVLALLLLPVVAVGEATNALPFGLEFGMNTEAVKAAIAVDETLSKQDVDIQGEEGESLEFLFFDVAIPGTDFVADSVSAQVDYNNSAKADRLTSISFIITPSENSIADFRSVLAAMSTTLGAPELDPFSEDAADAYVEWGTLDASWSLDNARISLSLNRMFGDSISIQYTSRLNYDKADLAQ